jgi:serine/threonine-protein kinase
MLEASSDVVVRRRLQPGTQVGKHLVIRGVLGSGGTSVVYEALHTRLDAPVAVKVAHVSLHGDEEAEQRLEREARVCAGIEDPRVPRVYDMGELEDGRPYLVMQKVSGTTLEELMAQGRIEARTALRIAREVLSALCAVHANGVVHRDVKPSNVIARFGERGFPRVHLMDFGVSKETTSRASSPSLTRPGAILGTPLYMAPEQMAGDPVDARADLYAVGVLLYEMLAGRAPFTGCSSAEIMAAVLRRDHPALDEVWPEAPAALVALVARAMAERAQERFASARDMRDALDASMYTVEAPEPAPLSVAPVSRGVRATWTAVAMAIGCAVFVGSSATKVGSDATWLGPLANEALKQVARAEIAHAAAPPPPPPPVAAAAVTVEAIPAQEAKVPELRSLKVRAPKPVRLAAKAAPAAPTRTVARPKPPEPPYKASVVLANSLRELEALRNQLDVSAASGVSEPANPDYQVTD